MSGTNGTSVTTETTAEFLDVASGQIMMESPGESHFFPIDGRLTRFSAVELRRGFEVQIDQKSYNQMMRYVTVAAPKEVSGFAKVKREGNIFIIDGTILFAQSNTEVSTLLSRRSMAIYKLDMTEKGIDIDDHNCWWHSHGNGGVGWSSQDLRTMDMLASKHYTVSLNLNSHSDLLARIDFYDPARYAIDNLKVKVMPSSTPEELAVARRELKRLEESKAARVTQ